ncbi:hypothetical protein [Streptomyces iconiensis]|uniref:Transposase, YhgA-like n=1 Tax=Streptomyces iconiensis TaxID=1384038 RepID=A0ABT6ZXT1_9ACTN|nr:hypothetical protein [Streptomyces iconiensis]MDJ1133882.1 hypothetical protein [Streptomyces iconiensis]
MDSVLRIKPADGGTPTLLAIEAQSEPSPKKAASWAYYTSHLHAKHNCTVLLVVVCHDKATVEWAAGPHRLGSADWTILTVTPLVLGPGNVPLILDADEAAKDLPMATFAAMTHGKSPDAPAILDALARALGRADVESRNYYSELLESGLGNTPAQRTWRKIMKVNGSYFPGRGTLVEETFLEGKAAGLAEGEARGEARGEVKGEARGEAKGRAAERARMVLYVLDNHGVTVSDGIRKLVSDCTDLDVLDQLLERAFTVTRAEDLLLGTPTTSSTPTTNIPASSPRATSADEA